MANNCEGTFEFLFDDKKQAEKMQSDFERLLKKKGENPSENSFTDGYYFAKIYFPTICDSIDCRCEISDIREPEKIGDKYGFTMYTDDAWNSKIGLWTAICKKYYGGEVHYSSYDPGEGLCGRWDPDGSINGAGKYYLELDDDDELEIYANVDGVEDIKSLTDGAFDRLYEDGDSVEDFVDKIQEDLGDDADVSIHEWGEMPPEEADFVITPRTFIWVRDFDFDSVKKADIGALINGKDGKGEK